MFNRTNIQVMPKETIPPEVDVALQYLKLTSTVKPDSRAVSAATFVILNYLRAQSAQFVVPVDAKV